MSKILFLLMLSNIPRLVSAYSGREHQARIDDVKCYSLPYGGAGFALHILTIYVTLMVWNQRSPWRFHKLTHKGIDITLSAICFLVTVIVGLINMSRCHFSNSFKAIAYNELFLSAFFGCFCWHAASWAGVAKEPTADLESNPAAAPEISSTAEQSAESSAADIPSSKEEATSRTPLNDNASEITAVEDLTPQTNAAAANTTSTTTTHKKAPTDSMFWMIPYFICASVTIAGVLRIAVYEIPDNRDLERVSLVFGTIAAIYALQMAAVSVCGAMSEKEASGWKFFAFFLLILFGVTVMGFGILGPLYTDWVLASLLGNWGGVQSSTSGGAALYWVYFTARLLPFFFF